LAFRVVGLTALETLISYITARNPLSPAGGLRKNENHAILKDGGMALDRIPTFTVVVFAGA
jgi:hypothetical protein